MAPAGMSPRSRGCVILALLLLLLALLLLSVDGCHGTYASHGHRPLL